MVRPGRLRHPDALGACLAHQADTLEQRAAAARRSEGYRAPLLAGGMILAEDKVFDMATEIGVTALPLIDFRRLRREETGLGFLHRRKDRGLAREVFVHADAKIILVGARIGAEGHHQAQQSVGRERGQGREMRHGKHPEKMVQT